MTTEQGGIPDQTTRDLAKGRLTAWLVGDLRKDEGGRHRAAAKTRLQVAARTLQVPEAIDNLLPPVNGAISTPEGFDRVSIPGILVGQVGPDNAHPQINAKTQYITHSVLIIEANGGMAVYLDGYDDGVDFDSRRELTDDEVLQMKRPALLAIQRIVAQGSNY
jgi:hypothetical protein